MDKSGSIIKALANSFRVAIVLKHLKITKKNKTIAQRHKRIWNPFRTLWTTWTLAFARTEAVMSKQGLIQGRYFTVKTRNPSLRLYDEKVGS